MVTNLLSSRHTQEYAMNEETKRLIEAQLEESLDTMDVPVKRKELTEANLLWLQRNLFIRNGNHPELPTAKHFIAILLTLTEPG